MSKNFYTCNYNKDDFSNCCLNDIQSFKLISTNFRGLRSKHESFTSLINTETPHEDGCGGGVLFACQNTINCIRLDIKTDCEAIACKVELSDNRTLIVLVIYRPPNRDLHYMQSICNLIEYLCCTYVNAIIRITGDFNFNWELNTVVSNAYPLSRDRPENDAHP